MNSRIDSARFAPPSRATRIPSYARTRPLARAITPLNTRLNLHGDATAAAAYLRCGLRRSQLRTLLRDDRGAVSRFSCHSIEPSRDPRVSCFPSRVHVDSRSSRAENHRERIGRREWRRRRRECVIFFSRRSSRFASTKRASTSPLKREVKREEEEEECE